MFSQSCRNISKFFFLLLVATALIFSTGNLVHAQDGGESASDGGNGTSSGTGQSTSCTDAGNLCSSGPGTAPTCPDGYVAETVQDGFGSYYFTGSCVFVPSTCAYGVNASNTACCVSTSGQSCSASSACGTSSGTYSCEGVCSATAPSVPSNYGQSCTSSANSCGQTNTGTIQCSGSCSATTPADSLCPTKPDLTAGAITPTTGSTTASITYSATISNLTAVSARSSSTLFQKANDASGGGFSNLGTASAASVAGNGSVVSTYAYKFPPEDAGTTKYLRACADTTTLVDEANEGNNCGEWTAVYVQPVGGTGGICPNPPGTPANYGSACPSAPNCAGTTNTGTIQCDGSCSATRPANPPGDCLICSGSPPPNYGNACQSAANCVGNRNTGTILCSGACSASAPADPVAGCSVPSLSLEVDKNRVHPSGTVRLTWWAHKVVSCTLTGPSTSAFGTGDGDHNIPTRITTSAPVTGQSVFTLSCEATNGSTISASQTVNMVPDWIEL